jgi:hypothetical protein
MEARYQLRQSPFRLICHNRSERDHGILARLGPSHEIGSRRSETPATLYSSILQ